MSLDYNKTPKTHYTDFPPTVSEGRTCGSDHGSLRQTIAETARNIRNVPGMYPTNDNVREMVNTFVLRRWSMRRT